MRGQKKIRVLVIDDSALVRRMLTEVLTRERRIEVIGTAADPYAARDKIKKLNPDVITLDVEMPRMDGITFLENLMRLRPMPVLMVSSLTQHGAEVTLRALELGAVDFVAKPRVDIAGTLGDYAEELIGKVLAAASARVLVGAGRAADVDPRLSADAILPAVRSQVMLRTSDRIVAVGASTGGTEALRRLLCALPATAPAVVVVQHIPAAFSKAFADRVNQDAAMSVCQAEDGQQLLAGHAYIAPGDHHLLIERDGARYRCRLHAGPPVNRHRPSVDVLFRSVAQHAGANALGVLLTGMGDDGARGLLELREAGSPTAAQDEASSVVWGMPGAAVKLGAAEAVLPLPEIAPWILRSAAGTASVAAVGT